MRNDFPGHPSGPLKEPVNLSEVIELRKSAADKVVMSIVCIVPGIGIGLTMMFGPEHSQFMGLVVTLLSIGVLYYVFAETFDGPPTIRIRPDGLEFPLAGKAPIHWDDVASIELGIMNIVGGGGEHDFLGIKLKPDLNYPSRGGLSGAVAKAVARWDFDICYGISEVNRPITHIIMEMRARLEASRQSTPAAPSGAQPIHPGAFGSASQ